MKTVITIFFLIFSSLTYAQQSDQEQIVAWRNPLTQKLVYFDRNLWTYEQNNTNNIHIFKNIKTKQQVTVSFIKNLDEEEALDYVGQYWRYNQKYKFDDFIIHEKNLMWDVAAGGKFLNKETTKRFQYAMLNLNGTTWQIISTLDKNDKAPKLHSDIINSIRNLLVE